MFLLFFTIFLIQLFFLFNLISGFLIVLSMADGQKSDIPDNLSEYGTVALPSFTNWACQFSKEQPPISAMVPPWPIFDNTGS